MGRTVASVAVWTCVCFLCILNYIFGEILSSSEWQWMWHEQYYFVHFAGWNVQKLRSICAAALRRRTYESDGVGRGGGFFLWMNAEFAWHFVLFIRRFYLSFMNFVNEGLKAERHSTRGLRWSVEKKWGEGGRERHTRDVCVSSQLHPHTPHHPPGITEISHDLKLQPHSLLWVTWERKAQTPPWF